MTAKGKIGSLNVLAAIAQEQRETGLINYSGGRSKRVQGVVVHPKGGGDPDQGSVVLHTGKRKNVVDNNSTRAFTIHKKPTVGSALPKASISASLSSNDPSPAKYLQELFQQEHCTERIPRRAKMGDFVKPSDEEVDCYNKAVGFVRGNDLEQLKGLHEQGHNLDACNRVGESLLMVACRRGHTEMVDFLIRTVQVRIELRDDFGRTLLHDACWRPDPCTELMDVLLRVVSPEWLLAQDVRGHTPFDYTRREHWGVWNDFLKEREELLTRRLSLISS